MAGRWVGGLGALGCEVGEEQGERQSGGGESWFQLKMASNVNKL